jgi:hypothetical protein
MKLKIIKLFFTFSFFLSIVFSGIHSAKASEVEVEPNDSREFATLVKENGTYHGMINGYWDTDYYRVNLKEPGNLTISMKNHVEDSWNISVENDEGDTFTYFSTQYGVVVKDEGVLYTENQVGLPAGNYYIRITGNDLINEMYELNVTFEPSKNYEQEFNNSKETATLISVNDSYNGVINQYYDTDYFKFKLDKPGNIKIKMENHVDNSWYLVLENGSGSEYLSYSTKYGVAVKDEGVKYTEAEVGLPEGNYYIRITGNDLIGKPYTLSVEYEESNNYEKEFNNQKETATLININEFYQGAINKYYDTDYYKLNLSSAANVVFSMSNHKDNSWYISIFDNKGNYYEDITTEYGTDIKDKTYMTLPLPAGVYYLEIHGNSLVFEPYQFGVFIPSFKDVRADFWAIQEIEWAKKENIISGYKDGTFRPNDTFTEAQFVSILTKYFGLKPRSVKKDEHWAQGMYDALKEAGITLKGHNNDTIKNKPVTRGTIAQAIAMSQGQSGELREAVQFMYDHNLSTGRNGVKTFEAYGVNETLKRSQAAAFFFRLNQNNITKINN